MGFGLEAKGKEMLDAWRNGKNGSWRSMSAMISECVRVAHRKEYRGTEAAYDVERNV